jgi:hypothetical protein
LRAALGGGQFSLFSV